MLTIDQEFLKTRPLSYSSIKQFKRSPLHYYTYLTEPREPASDAQKLGSLVEQYLLNPEKVDKYFFVIGTIDRRSNAGKELFANAVIEAGNRTIVTPEMVETAKLCAAQVMNNPFAKELVENKRYSQLKLEWIEKQFKLPCIGYVDFDSVLSTGVYSVELKTTRNADFDAFCYDLFKMQYHLQPAMYSIGYHKMRYEFPRFVWIVVETCAPYGVNVIEFPDKELQKVKNEVLGLMSAFRMCIDEQKFHEDYRFWLGLTQRKAQSLMIPKWKESPIQFLEDE
jgi:hypothetical protein